jgi:hypothetical protein
VDRRNGTVGRFERFFAAHLFSVFCDAAMICDAMTAFPRRLLPSFLLCFSIQSFCSSTMRICLSHSLVGVLAGLLLVAAREQDAMMTFEEFVTHYQKSYPDPFEYQRRQAIFEQNRQTIIEHNQQRQRGHSLGVNWWADHEAEELPRGYDKSQSTLRLSASVLQQEKPDLLLYAHLPFTVEPVHLLPKAVDWRAAGVTTPVKNQGRCGSCWAFASTSVLESHVALTTGKLMTLSVQELVSCAPNPRHCGGTGGCAGATAELAFQHVAEHGMVQEWEFGYQSYHGEAINCSLSETTTEGITGLRGGVLSTGDTAASTQYTGAVAGIEGYMTLPSNDYVALMNAVAKHGPVAVSVACLPWHLYQGGVFYAPLNNTRATDIGKKLIGRNETVFLRCVTLLLCEHCLAYSYNALIQYCAQITWSYWRDTEKIP